MSAFTGMTIGQLIDEAGWVVPVLALAGVVTVARWWAGLVVRVLYGSRPKR